METKNRLFAFPWFQSKPDSSSPASIAPLQPPVGLVLAAGTGKRFDPSGQRNKLLAPIDGVPAIAQVISTLHAVIAEVLVVVRRGAHREQIEEIAEGLGAGVAVCEDAASGMGHSLAWGISEIQQRYAPQSVIIALGDMPYIKASTVQSIAAHLKRPSDVVVPTFNGERGNPVGFGSDHFESLGRLTGDRGARLLLQQLKPTLLAVNDPGILADIDQPSDIQ